MTERGLRNNGLRAGLDQVAHKLLEETFGATLIIFAALVLAKQLSILDFANVVLTDVVQAVDAATARALSPPKDFADVQTVLIGDRADETEFGHQSPLPRAPLARLVTLTAAAPDSTTKGDFFGGLGKAFSGAGNVAKDAAAPVTQ